MLRHRLFLLENKLCDTFFKKPNIYLSMYGKVYFVTIRSIIAARCSKSEKRDWQLFSRDLTRKQRVPGGETWTHGLRMIYICILVLKNTLIHIPEWLWTGFIPL